MPATKSADRPENRRLSLQSITTPSFIRPPRLLIHGEAGVGKTTFASQSEHPVFLPTEDGFGTLKVNTFPLLTTFSQVIEALDALVHEAHDYQTLVVDSLDHLEPLVWDHTCRVHRVTSIEKFGYGKGYIEALGYWRQVMDRINRCRQERDMTVALIAHSEIRRFEAPDSEAYDRYQIKLHKRAAELVLEYCDCVFFCQLEVLVSKEDKGFGKTRARAISSGDRVLYTENRPAFVAKNRYHLPFRLPLSWAAYNEALAQSLNPS